MAELLRALAARGRVFTSAPARSPIWTRAYAALGAHVTERALGVDPRSGENYLQATAAHDRL